MTAVRNDFPQKGRDRDKKQIELWGKHTHPKIGETKERPTTYKNQNEDRVCVFDDTTVEVGEWDGDAGGCHHYFRK